MLQAADRGASRLGANGPQNLFNENIKMNKEQSQKLSDMNLKLGSFNQRGSNLTHKDSISRLSNIIDQFRNEKRAKIEK